MAEEEHNANPTIPYSGRFSSDFINAELDSRLGQDILDGDRFVLFGKFAGLRYKELPDYYLDWMVFKQVKTRTALLEIKRRMIESTKP
jgi:hypothetical protein